MRQVGFKDRFGFTFTLLETPRLVLRRFDDQVLAHIMNNYSDSEIKDFFGITSDEQLNYHKSWNEKGCTTFNKSILFFHLLEPDSNRCIGWCGYHTWYVDHDRAELGYVMNSENDMGKGLMSEALESVIEYGFNEMDLHRIEAMAAPDNKGSLRLLEKNRFTFEGVLREHYKVKGRNEDSNIYSLLRSDAESATQ